MAVKQILGKVTVTPKGEYSSGETYKRLDIVTSNGQSYIAKVDNTGVSVTDTNTWLQLVEKPEKGIDYFTEEDIAQLVSMVTDDSESEFNEYYNGKVSDFDSNASSKTSEFNSNYDEKVESFNTIFDTSTDNFDSNYETKLSAFNENASTQTSTFNSVVEQATSDFNSNASTLTETFNTNASEKTSAFNTNASEKTQEFNDNVDEKTEQITTQLDNYVQFDNYPSNEKAGVIKPSNNFMVDPSNGYVYAEALDVTSYYENTDSTSFISKGTLENIKDDYVGSSTPVKNLNANLKDITPKQDAEGTDNVFDDGLKSPLYALAGDGKSEQVVTQGYNLCNGISQSYYLNNTATLCGITQGNSGLIIETNGIENYTVSTKINQERYRVACSNSLPTGSGTKEVTVYNGVNKDNTSDDITINTSSYSYLIVNATDLSSIQIVEGDTAKPFEPYTNGVPSPSPDYPQEINSIEGSVEFACRGKNWLPNYLSSQNVNGINITKNDDGSITLNGTATKSTSLAIADLTNFSLQGTYNFYLIGKNDKINLQGIEDGETVIYLPFSYNTNDYITKEYETAKNLTRIFSYISSGTTFNNETFKYMITQGSGVKIYEPYVEPNKVTFNLGQEKLRSVGDVKDELVVDLDTGDYYKVEKISETILDGSNDEGWNNVSDGTAKERYTSPKIQNLVYTGTKLCQSNYFKNNTSEEYYVDGTIRIAPSGGVTIYDDLFTSLDNFKQWLSTHNTIVNYILKTPTTKKLGTLSAEDLAKLKTFKGYNNVTVNTNLGLMNIRFTYGLDIKKYIDNKLAEISAQLIKGE